MFMTNVFIFLRITRYQDTTLIVPLKARKACLLKVVHCCRVWQWLDTGHLTAHVLAGPVVGVCLHREICTGKSTCTGLRVAHCIYCSAYIYRDIVKFRRSWLGTTCTPPLSSLRPPGSRRTATSGYNILNNHTATEVPLSFLDISSQFLFVINDLENCPFIVFKFSIF